MKLQVFLVVLVSLQLGSAEECGVTVSLEDELTVAVQTLLNKYKMEIKKTLDEGINRIKDIVE